LLAATATPFTGAVARIEAGGRVVFERAYGSTRADASARPVYLDTRFDLASITKLFVATLALQAVADGAIALDQPLVRWFPEWTDTAHAAITLRMLLAHDAGLNSGADYRQLLGFDVERYAIERELVERPGAKVIYSDLGFIVLGALIARVRGASLATVFARGVGSPTNGFRPPVAERPAIPATEEDGWRKATVTCRVRLSLVRDRHAVGEDVLLGGRSRHGQRSGFNRLGKDGTGERCCDLRVAALDAGRSDLLLDLCQLGI